MMLGIGTEALIFLYAGLSGITVMAVYYALVLFRKLIRHKNWVISLEDFFSGFLSVFIYFIRCTGRHMAVYGGFLY